MCGIMCRSRELGAKEGLYGFPASRRLKLRIESSQRRSSCCGIGRRAAPLLPMRAGALGGCRVPRKSRRRDGPFGKASAERRGGARSEVPPSTSWEMDCMRRIVSVWLPYWRTERLARRHRGKSHEQSVGRHLRSRRHQGRQTSCRGQPESRRSRLAPGVLLTDACAILPSLKTSPPLRLTKRRTLRSSPPGASAIRHGRPRDGPTALALDVTGACHLLAAMKLCSMTLSLGSVFGLSARAAIAGTLGAAWALSRYGKLECVVLPEGEEGRFIALLPVQGLRVGEAECALLERLGLTTIGQLFDLPREALRARLGLGRIASSRSGARRTERTPIAFVAETLYAARLNFAEPITSLDSLLYVTELLAHRVAEQLQADRQRREALCARLLRHAGRSFRALRHACEAEQ